MKKSKLKPGPLLSKVNSPDDLKRLSVDELRVLAKELRDFILDVVSVHPGHLGASLGVVELTIALHYVFNTPYDKLIWDVGHQAYSHKILTGRRDVFDSLRQYGGISGFPVRDESEYDAFGTGHASTSVSAALGMAVASKLRGETGRRHIAVIGDGALTGGMALEALNNAGASNANILIVLNDNGIAIDKSQGALKDYLVKISAYKPHSRMKNAAWKGLKKTLFFIPGAGNTLQRLGNAVKGSVFISSNLFESFNFRYFGPVDGHNIPLLIRILNDIKDIEGPKILHVATVKGKGFKRAEQEQTIFHAPGKFNRNTGELEKKETAHTFQEVYGKSLLELARGNKNIVAVTPAMPTGSALTYMSDEMPGRVFDVGIAEQHAVTFAAGMAAEGLKPFCTVYSTFLQRAYDQIIHDVALQKLPVVFGIDRAGLVGADGATHHGFFDLAVLNAVPGIVVAAPMTEAELRNMMFTASKYGDGPFAIRYPRDKGVLKNARTPFQNLIVGKGRVVVSSNGKTALVSLGHAGNQCFEAIRLLRDEGVDAAHYDMRFLKPLDEELLEKIFNKHDIIITVEDGMITGGFGMTVTAFAGRYFPGKKIVALGIPDNFVKHGTLNELYKECGMDAVSIKQKVLELI